MLDSSDNILHKRRIWQLIIMIASTFIAIYIPLNIVLDISHGFSLKFLYWMITLIFTADIIINFLFPSIYIADQDEFREIRSKYLKSWFFVDLLAAIPFAFIFNAPVLEIIRLIKFSRVVQFMQYLRHRAIILGDYIVLGFFVFWLLLLSHWFACGWIYLRGSTVYGDNVTIYITSLYWVIETLTTVGYGETAPLTNAQYIFAMIIMLAGVGTYGFIIGNVANILSKSNPARTQFFNNLEQLKIFVSYRNIPVKLQKRVSDYFNYIWKKRLGFDESVFLSSLPQGLQNEVSVHLKREILQNIPLFKGVSDEFLIEISLHMRPIVCVPDEFVFKENDIGHEMFFIIRGKLEVISNKEVLTVLTDGDFFGEIALFTDKKRRTATVKSVHYSDLYRLDRELFEEVLKRYPQIAAHIKEIAEERMKINKNSTGGN